MLVIILWFKKKSNSDIRLFGMEYKILLAVNICDSLGVVRITGIYYRVNYFFKLFLGI